MAWRGCGAAATGSLSACVLHPFPFPENPRSFLAGSPRGTPLYRGFPFSSAPLQGCVNIPSEAPPILRPRAAHWGASGSVRCRLGWFGSRVFCLLSVFCSLRVVGWRGTKTGARHEGHPFRSAGAKWRTLRKVSKVPAALGLRSPGAFRG